MRTWGLLLLALGVLVIYLGVTGKSSAAWAALKTGSANSTIGGSTGNANPGTMNRGRPNHNIKPDENQGGIKA